MAYVNAFGVEMKTMAKKKEITVDAEAAAALDINNDGHISAEEISMDLEFKRKRLEDQDAQRDAMRKMTWFALFGMLLYPVGIAITSWLGLDEASGLIGDIAPTYFVAISALVSVFFGANAYSSK